MTKQLSQWWVTGTIVSELFSSLLLIFLVLLINFLLTPMSIRKKIVKWVALPFFFGFSGMISIFSGSAIGNAVSPGDGLALMSGTFTFIKAIYFNSFKLVPAAIAFQMIGSFIGVAIYLFVSHIIMKFKNKRNFTPGDGLIISQEKITYSLGIKEFSAQILFVSGLVFISSTNFNMGPSGNFYFSTFLSSLLIVALFIIFTKHFYFILSPQLMIASMVAGHIYGKTKLANWITLGFLVMIQVSIVSFVAYPEYRIRTRT